MKKNFLFTFIILFTYLAIGNYFYNIAINSNTNKSNITKQDKDEKFDLELEDNIKWFKNNHIEIESVSVSKKSKLYGYIFENINKDKWVIVVHGYNSSALEQATHIKEFYNMGYSVFAPDLLSFGKSEGNFTSMGKFESEDLVNWINILESKYNNVSFILFGRSMGAATVLNSIDKLSSKKILALISDSAYIKLEDIYKYQLKKLYNLPFYPLKPSFKLITYLRAGFNIDDVDATYSLKNTKIPALFLHGENDTFVKMDNSLKAYNLVNSKKEIKIFKNSKHVQSHFIYKDEYWNTIKNFLKFK